MNKYQGRNFNVEFRAEKFARGTAANKEFGAICRAANSSFWSTKAQTWSRLREEKPSFFYHERPNVECLEKKDLHLEKLSLLIGASP